MINKLKNLLSFLGSNGSYNGWIGKKISLIEVPPRIVTLVVLNGAKIIVKAPLERKEHSARLFEDGRNNINGVYSYFRYAGNYL
jgi:hypothetical protein